MAKYIDINNAEIAEIADSTIVSKWAEIKYGLIATRVFSKEAGLPLIFSCCAEVKQSSVANRKIWVREAAKMACDALSGVGGIAANWNSYEGKDFEYYVEGFLDGANVLLLSIEASQVASYHDFAINAFGTSPYKDLACSLVGLIMVELDPAATRFRGKR